MQLTDAQFRLLGDAAARGDIEILRGEDASEATLRSLARRHLAELVYEPIGLRRVVTAARINTAGWLAWSREADRRDEAERIAAIVAGPARVEPDPFAVYASTAEARLAARIDAAFAV